MALLNTCLIISKGFMFFMHILIFLVISREFFMEPVAPSATHFWRLKPANAFEIFWKFSAQNWIKMKWKKFEARSLSPFFIHKGVKRAT